MMIRTSCLLASTHVPMITGLRCSRDIKNEAVEKVLNEQIQYER